jgi:phospholipid-binding lipoprotein MlaA
LRRSVLLAAAIGLGLSGPARAEPASTAAAATSDFDQFEEFSKPQEEAQKVSDPLGGYNRFMFKVNDKFYTWIARPLAKGYKMIFPQPLRVAVDRAFQNIGAPLRMINAGLELDPYGFSSELGRFVVNSTIGLGGLFDPADKWLGIKQIEADFGMTLGRYGVGHGPPLVLPILGPSNLRDAIGLIPTSAANPVYYFARYPDYVKVVVGDKFNYLSLHHEEYDKIKKDAIDPYTFMRDASLQYRQKKIDEIRRYKWD